MPFRKNSSEQSGQALNASTIALAATTMELNRTTRRQGKALAAVTAAYAVAAAGVLLSRAGSGQPSQSGGNTPSSTFGSNACPSNSGSMFEYPTCAVSNDDHSKGQYVPDETITVTATQSTSTTGCVPRPTR